MPDSTLTRKSVTRQPQTQSRAPARPAPTAAPLSGARLSQALTAPLDAQPGDLLELQRGLGNQAVQRLLASHSVQARLTVGPAGDHYEQEADRVAGQVMTMATTLTTDHRPAVQRQEDEEEIQTKPLASTITPLVQRQAEEEDAQAVQTKPLVQRAAEDEDAQALQTKRLDPRAGFVAGEAVESQLQAQQGHGSPLPADVRAYMEPRFGADFSGVRLHTGGEAVQLYTTDGNWISTFPAADQKPKVFGTDGFTPYHVGLLNGRVIVSTADGLYFFDQDGKVIARWGGTYKGENLRGAGPGVFNFPDSFVTDPATGDIYVTDTMNRRVLAIDQNGFWKWDSGTPDENGKITSFWQLPRGIAIGPDDGNLYVIDTFRFDQKGMGTGHVVVLSKDGQLLSEFGRAGTSDGDFNYPDQLAAGPDGLWAVADRENNRVVVFRLHTPYPAVDDLLARRYDKGFSTPDNVWVTPPPVPSEQNTTAG